MQQFQTCWHWLQEFWISTITILFSPTPLQGQFPVHHSALRRWFKPMVLATLKKQGAQMEAAWISSIPSVPLVITIHLIWRGDSPLHPVPVQYKFVLSLPIRVRMLWQSIGIWLLPEPMQVLLQTCASLTMLLKYAAFNHSMMCGITTARGLLLPVRILHSAQIHSAPM